MTAKEARAKIEAAYELENKDQYNRIKLAIEKAVEARDFSLDWNERLTNSVRTKLEDEEYTVSAGYSGHEGYIVNISW
jgi:hypothetical protein